jgi:ribonuclease HIII
MLPAFYQENQIEAGCDEAGRGCYAGPVFAAAVILPINFKHPLLNDSKLSFNVKICLITCCSPFKYFFKNLNFFLLPR